MTKLFFSLLCLSICHHSMTQSVGLKLKDSPSLKIDIKSISTRHDPKAVNTKSVAFQSPYKYYESLGFMCKWEWKINTKLKNPIRFRLGSYEYVNKMEGK